MRVIDRILLAGVLALAGGCASAADLRGPPGGYGERGARVLQYGELWGRGGPVQPSPCMGVGRRVMCGADYVGSNYGLGKPAYSGIGPRPDWGRSSYD